MNINNPTTFASPNLTLSTSNSSGTSGALRADDTILIYDTTLVDAITYGQSGSVGSAATASRRDHAHAMAAANVDGQATKTEAEGETDVNEYLAPDFIRYSPGVAKAWATWEMTDAHGLLASYNYTSVTDGGDTGETDHLIDDDFTSANYVIVGIPQTGTGGMLYVTTTPAQLAGGFTTVMRQMDGTREDVTAFVVCFGVQVDP